MAVFVDVGDPADPRLDDYRDLKRADRRPDRPGGRGLVIAEGTNAVQRLLDSPYPVRSVLGIRPRVDDLAARLAALDVPVYVTSAEVMDAVIGFHLNRGVLAVADRAAPVSWERLLSGRVLLGLEGVNDHENIGSLFRNAAAFGVDGVLVGPGCPDPLYRRSVRVSMGHVLHVPFARVDDIGAAASKLRAVGFTIAALTPRPGAVPVRDFARSVERAILFLGSEGHGLSEDVLSVADVAVRIPIAEHVDSLNVAVAGAIACYEMAERARLGQR
ncbi:RNA methyltransferase [Thermocrispum sp.]|uniref:RNA methyltransferase n=1 Tax=Thermocrispum agreste TaxID=37925 RepID=A0ABD6F9Q5_9PSEU|nr:RNA methyltransferase [Thermocrispum sp.]